MASADLLTPITLPNLRPLSPLLPCLLWYVIASGILSIFTSIPRPFCASWQSIVPGFLAFNAFFTFTLLFPHLAVYAPLITWLDVIHAAVTWTLYKIVLG